jgi:hypothetical protein
VVVAVLRQWHLSDRVLKAELRDKWLSNGGRGRRFFEVKSLRFDDNGDDAFGCRYPLGRVVEGTFVELGLRGENS